MFLWTNVAVEVFLPHEPSMQARLFEPSCLSAPFRVGAGSSVPSEPVFTFKLCIILQRNKLLDFMWNVHIVRNLFMLLWWRLNNFPLSASMSFNEFMYLCYVVILYTHLPSLCLCSAEPSFFLFVCLFFVHLLFVPGFLFPVPPGIWKYSKAWEIEPWAAFEEGVSSYWSQLPVWSPIHRDF